MTTYIHSLGINVHSLVECVFTRTLDADAYSQLRPVLEAVLVDRESRIAYMKILKSISGGQYAHRNILPEDIVELALTHGMQSLSNDICAQLAINPTAISQLSWEISEQCPEEWLVHFNRIGEFYGGDEGAARILEIARAAIQRSDPPARPAPDSPILRSPNLPLFSFGNLRGDDDDDDAVADEDPESSEDD